jgi:hypothetical protein
MINFIQLNRDSLSMDPCILSIEILEEIHNILSNLMYNNSKVDPNLFSDYLQTLSINYNTDKQTILIKYFNHVICTYKHLLTKEFFVILEIILHTSDIKIQNTIQYIVDNINIVYNK